jgi:adenylate cyclase
LQSPRRRTRLLLEVILVSALSAALFSVLFVAGATRRLDWVAYDLLFQIRGARAGSPDIVTVDIDDETVRDLGKFPFSREHYPKLIRALAREGSHAQAVAFDIFFLEPDVARDGEVGRAAREHGRIFVPALLDPPLAPRRELERAVAARRELAAAAVHQLEPKQNQALFARFQDDPWAARGELAEAVRRSAKPGDPEAVRRAGPESFDILTVRLIEEEHRRRVRKLVEQRTAPEKDDQEARKKAVVGFLKGEFDSAFEQDFSPERLKWAKRLVLGEGKADALWDDYRGLREKDGSAGLMAACAAAPGGYERLVASKVADGDLRRRLATERSVPAGAFEAGALWAHSAEFPVLPVLDSARALVTVQPSLDSAEGTVRALPLVIVHQGRAYPSMGLAVALDVLGAKLEECRFEPGWFVIPAAAGRAERRIPVDDRGRALLNWNGPWLGSFAHAPMGSLIAGKSVGASLDGKIVFVGLTATATHDLNPTPFENRYPMVGANAELAEGILSDGFIRGAPRGWTLAAIALAALLGALAGAGLHKGWSAAAALVGLGGLAGGAYAAFSAGMVFVPPTGALGGFALAYVGGLFWRYLVTEREGRQVKRMFANRTSPELVELMMRNPGALRLGGKRTEATVFHADLAGFTTVAERLSPEELIALLNEYLSELSAAVIGAGGFLDKYEGDAVMAIFGAPVERADHARSACLAALGAHERLDRLRAQLRAAGQPDLPCRIGLNSGPMVAGFIGSRTRHDYTALGDAVNLASRIEGANKVYGTRILVSGRTAELAAGGAGAAGADFVFRELDLVRVQGRREPVRVLELVCRGMDAPQERREGLAVFARGLELYRARRFAEARDLFLESLEKLGGSDGPSEIFTGRSQRYALAPPPETWDGVYEMTGK